MPQVRPLSVFKFSALALAALLAATGCKKASPTEAQAAQTTQLAPVKVDTVAVQEVSTKSLLRLTGSLKGARETDLAANVSGRILETKVERGTRVKQGDIIARVDVRQAALQLAEAKVQAESSRTQEQIDQRECERFAKLMDRGAVTDVEYEQVMARCKRNPLNVEAAEARVSLAAKNVGDGIIRAPFSGVVTERFVDVGEYVQSSTRVVALAEVDALHLDFSLPEANFPEVALGSEVLFTVSAYPDRNFTGKVVHIGGAVRSTRDILIEASVTNTDGALLPGMFANVGLVVGTEKHPALPKEAVFMQNNKPNALVVKGGFLEQRVLQVLETQGPNVVASRGVQVGEKVVTPYKPELKNGQPAL
jgi:membrane fusion protein, multidrug efflux system